MINCVKPIETKISMTVVGGGRQQGFREIRRHDRTFRECTCNNTADKTDTTRVDFLLGKYKRACARVRVYMHRGTGSPAAKKNIIINGETESCEAHPYIKPPPPNTMLPVKSLSFCLNIKKIGFPEDA